MAEGNTRLARKLVWFAAFVNVALLLMMCSLAGMGAGWFLALLLLVAVDGSVGYYAISQGLTFEWQQERTWKAVCGGLGGSFKGEGMSVARSVRAGVASRGRHHVSTQTKTIYPRLRDVHGSREGWTGIVTPFAGQTVEDYTKHADAFALAFHVPFVTFDINAENGLIGVRAGKVPVPDAYDHPGQIQTLQDGTTLVLTHRKAHWQPQNDPKLVTTRVGTGPLLQAVPVVADAEQRPVLASELKLLQSVPMARDLHGRHCRIPIEGQHWFIAARTGGGKGSWIWSLVLGLAPAWRAGLVKFWGCDPKRLELAIGRDWWEHYADNEADIVAMLEQCVQEMFARAGQLQGKYRKFTPSPDMPLNVVVVDELGYLSAMLPDRKLRERAEKAVSTILALGRAVGYSLVGAVQDPRKETVGFRDMFPIRIAGGLPGPMVDLVLGEGMHDAGAFCEQIPLGVAGAGVGYVISETSLKPLCVRAAWCDDDTIRNALVAVPARALYEAHEVKDEQLGRPAQPLKQFTYRVE